MTFQSFSKLLLFTTLFFSLSEVRADLVTIYFKEGDPTTVELVEVEQARLLWKQSASATDVQVALRSQVENVIFPTTEAWRDAENAFQSGRLDEALKLYRQVINDPAGNYFPFPGNFVSLAKERMLQCFRLQLDASRIAKQAEVVREEFFHLPPEYKRVEPETAAWTAVANEQWEKALTALEAVENPVAETFFLRGRALEALGRKEEAISEYAGVYVLNFGGSIQLTKQALQRSSNLIFELNDPEKTAELQAQVKIFRDLYGKGKLWDGAPEKLVSLAEAEIKPLGDAENEMIQPEEAGEEMNGPVVSESATVVALPPKEERDYLLAEELPNRVFSTGAGEESVTLVGGVTKEGESFRFDGTDGFLRLEPINANAPFTRFRIQFEANVPDGIIAHADYPRLGGFSLYLKGGELLMDWAPRRAKVETAALGKVEINQLTNLQIVFRVDGSRTTTINDTAKFDDAVPKGGLRINQIKRLKIGDRGEGDLSGTVLSKTPVPAFTGVIHHFSFSTGANYEDVNEQTLARFGKLVRLSPPPVEPELPASERE